MHQNKRAIITTAVNELYARYFFPCDYRYIFLFGGAGSGKSVATSQKLTMLINTQATTRHKILCVRKYYTDIYQSTYERICNDLDSQGLGGSFNYTKQPLMIAKKAPKGQAERAQSRFVFKGMDNTEQIKSIEGVTIIWIEEATQLTEEEFLQLDLRLRGVTNHYYQLILSFNPVSQDHWIAKYAEPQMLKEEERIPGTGEVDILVPNKVWEYKRVTIVDGEEKISKTRVLNTTAEDNRFTTSEYKSTLKALGGKDDLLFKIYTQGRWGTLNREGLFFPTFRRKKHVRSTKHIHYDPDLPLHLSIDFNVRPYMSGLVFQEKFISEGYWQGHNQWYEMRIIDEICAKSPFNTAAGLAKLFTSKYTNIKGFYLYGDATGKRSTGQEGIMGVKSLFDDFKRGLGIYKNYMIARIPSANPRYKAIAKGSLGRHAFMMLVIDGKNIPIRVLISETCTNTIKDLENCQVTAEGSMLKVKNKDGVEENGHLADCFMYAVCHQDLYGKYARIDF